MCKSKACLEKVWIPAQASNEFIRFSCLCDLMRLCLDWASWSMIMTSLASRLVPHHRGAVTGDGVWILSQASERAGDAQLMQAVLSDDERVRRKVHEQRNPGG